MSKEKHYWATLKYAGRELIDVYVKSKDEGKREMEESIEFYMHDPRYSERKFFTYAIEEDK